MGLLIIVLQKVQVDFVVYIHLFTHSLTFTYPHMHMHMHAIVYQDIHPDNASIGSNRSGTEREKHETMGSNEDVCG